MKVLIVLIILFITVSYAAEVTNVVPGIFSKKVVSNGLHLPATNTFSPITTLTTTVHIDQSYSIFLHYQFTFHIGNKNNDFFCKLVVNGADVGSLIHTGKQEHKNPTGFWMANLNAGLYTFEIHYKSPVNITVGATWDWQGAVLQVMWFKDARAVSHGIHCYPVSTPTNNYNNWGPITDLQVILQLPNDRAILAAYQLSTEMSSPSHVVTGLSVNGFYQQTTPHIHGDSSYLSLQGTWAGYYHDGIHYFNVLYKSPTTFSFTDCQHDYRDNKNLYAMMLPPSCRVTTINPRNTITVPYTAWPAWRDTDLKHTLVLSKLSHVIIMYQYTGHGPNSIHYMVLRIKINSVVQKHTVSVPAYTYYYGNFGLWQGPLDSGNHNIVVEYRNRGATTSTPNNWETRALTIMYC